jgi:hypothetical protein
MNNPTYRPGEPIDTSEKCFGCVHLSYLMPTDIDDASTGGIYKCAKFGASMGANDTPRPIEQDPSCKEHPSPPRTTPNP